MIVGCFKFRQTVIKIARVRVAERPQRRINVPSQKVDVLIRRVGIHLHAVADDDIGAVLRVKCAAAEERRQAAHALEQHQMRDADALFPRRNLQRLHDGQGKDHLIFIAALAANKEALSPRHAKRIGKFAGHPLSRRVNQVSAFVNRKESQGAVLRHQLILCRLKQLHECLLCRRGVESYGPIHYSQEIPLLFQRDGELLVHLRRNFRQLILAFAVEFFARIAGEKAHPKENERK